MKRDTTKDPLSIVIPALNEAGNLPLLVERIHAPLAAEGIEYEIILLDDHSSDSTIAVAQKLAQTYPLRHILKKGKRGKAYSLLEAFQYVNYPLVCMIDADLQYPPEAIVPMYQKLQTHNVDIVVTNRIEQKTSFLRQLSTKISHFLLARLLFGIDYDTQSGLKLFKRSVLNDMELHPSAWSFDLEFLVRSLEKHCTILSYAIPFGERHSGVTKVKLLSGTYAIVTSSLKLRMNSSIRKVRRGYLASTELSKGASALAVAFILGTLLSVTLTTTTAPSRASALSLQDIRRALSSDNKKSTSQQSTKTDTPPPSSTPAASTTPTAPQAASSPTASSPTPAAASSPTSTTAPTASASPVPAAAASTTPTPTPIATKPVASKKPNYYPGYGLSANRTNTLKNIALTLAISGSLAIVIALVTLTIRSAYRKRARRMIQRGLYQTSDF